MPKKPLNFWKLGKYGALGLAIIVGLSLTVYAATRPADNPTTNNSISSKYGTQETSLQGISVADNTTELAERERVLIGGRLQVDGSLILTPTVQPASAAPGQLYFDKDLGSLVFYNGTESVRVVTQAADGATVTGQVNSIGGASGAIGIGGGLTVAGGTIANAGVLSIQGQTGSVSLTGGNGIAVNGTQITNTGVTAVGGQSGNIALGSGLQINGGTLQNAGVTSIAGVTGTVSLGTGLALSGGQLRNTGITSIAAATPNLVISTDAFGAVTITDVGAGSGTVTSGGGTSGKIALFTGVQQIEDSIMSQNAGAITIDGDIVATGSLTTGALLTSGGVASGSGSFTGTVSGADAVGASDFVTLQQLNAATGGIGGGVASLNSLNGPLTVQGTPNDIVIADNGFDTITLSLGANVTKQGNTFNGADQLVKLNSSGALPTLSGQNLTQVNAAQLNGQAAAYYLDLSNATGTLSVARGGTGLTTLPANQLLYASSSSSIAGLSSGSAGMCLVSNGSGSAPSFQTCTGAGSLTGNGTAGTLPVYTGTGSTLGNSLLTQSGGTITIDGAVVADSYSGNGAGLTNVDAATLNGNNTAYFRNADNLNTGTLSDNRLSANVTVQGNTFNGASQLVKLDATGKLAVIDGSNLTNLNATNIASGTLSDSRLSVNVAKYNDTTANFTGSLQQGGADVCTTAGNCAGVGGNGDLSGSGTAGRLAVFSGSKVVASSTLLQGTGTLTLDGGNDLVISGGDLQVTGGGSFTGTVSGADATNTNEFVTLAQLTGAVGGVDSGVMSINGLDGTLSMQGTTNKINVTSTGDTITLALGTDVTVQGNTFNGANQLVQLNGSGALPTLNGSNLTNLDAGAIATGTLSAGRIADGSLGNAKLTNSSITVTAGTNLTGGGTVALGGTTTLNVSSTPSFASLALTNTSGAPFTVASTAKVVGLNADLLDGMDSTAFGDATAANQTAILGRIGVSSDSAGTGSLFARLARIDDTDLGATADAASNTGSIFARLSDLYNRIAGLETKIGATSDTASSTGSIFARLADLYNRVVTLNVAIGATGDTASTSGSVHAKLNWLIANAGSGGGDATQAKQDTIISKIDALSAKVDTFSLPKVVTKDVTVDLVGAGAQVDNEIYNPIGTAISDYGVVYATHATPTLSDSKVRNGATASPSKEYTSDMQGLIGETTYYVRAYITTAAGTTYGNERSFYTTAGGIGDFGTSGVGKIFYDKGSYSDGWRYLEAAPSDQSTGIAWCNNTSTLIGASGTAIGTGKANTDIMVANCTSGAGVTARNYTGGGMTDWFLPSLNELTELYNQRSVVGGFTSNNYWSSTENSATNARYVNFNSGSTNSNYKSNNYYVRAIRAF